jgi:thioester reductase-like protein
MSGVVVGGVSCIVAPATHVPGTPMHAAAPVVHVPTQYAQYQTEEHPAQMTATAVTRSVITTLRREMLLQFNRCQHSQELARQLPPSLQAIQHRQLPSLTAFRDMWDSPAFCSKAELRPQLPGSSPRLRLDIHLTSVHPVQAPHEHGTQAGNG